ncbi:MAG: hypothetical protein LIO37_05450 [Clostridiales bacterium]|nr:hypothetical protein [Clostridiales bacterium]
MKREIIYMYDLPDGSVAREIRETEVPMTNCRKGCIVAAAAFLLAACGLGIAAVKSRGRD